MRLIFDENLPVDLVQSFEPPHDVDHVEELGWKGIKNGDLLGRISGKIVAARRGATDHGLRCDVDVGAVETDLRLPCPRNAGN
jgi:hypothetical protein